MLLRLAFMLSLMVSCSLSFVQAAVPDASQDGELMIEVYSGREPEESLRGDIRKAYQIARKVVDDALAEHPNDEVGVAFYLHNYLVKNFKYASAGKRGGHVTNMLLKKKGVCENYARTYYALCSMAGLECQFISGKARGQRHAWNLVRLNGKWVHVDCTWDDPRDGTMQAPWYVYFGVPDEAISTSHKWKRRDFPACTTTKYWHAWNAVSHYETVDEFVQEAVRAAAEEKKATPAYGYVEEVAKNPKRLKMLMKQAVEKHCAALGAYRYEFCTYGNGSGALQAFIIFRLMS